MEDDLMKNEGEEDIEPVDLDEDEEEDDDLGLADPLAPKPKKDLIDEDTDSIEDLSDDELEEDDEPFDDITNN